MPYLFAKVLGNNMPVFWAALAGIFKNGVLFGVNGFTGAVARKHAVKGGHTFLAAFHPPVVAGIGAQAWSFGCPLLARCPYFFLTNLRSAVQLVFQRIGGSRPSASIQARSVAVSGLCVAVISHF